MTTYTLSGDLGTLTGANLVFPNGTAVRAWLAPPQCLTIVGSTVCVGTVELTLGATGTFTQSGIGRGDYQVIVLHYDYERRQATRTTLPVSVNADTTLSA